MTQDAPPATLIDLFEDSQSQAGRPFVSYVDDLDQPPVESLTYAEFHQRAQWVATNLSAIGVRQGDRVALVALPRTDYIVALAGTVLLGAIAAPINHHFKARELSATLDALDPAIIVADDETCKMVEMALERLPISRPIGGISGFTGGDVALTQEPPAIKYPRPEVQPTDTALILHSSGTTGLPKLVVRTHGTLTAFLNLFADYFEDDEHLANFLPLYHQAGLVLTVLAACRIKTDVVQFPRFSTSAFWRLIDTYGITHVNLVSPMASFILTNPSAENDQNHSLKWVVIAGRNDHWADFQDRFAVTGMTFYGSTETLQITSTGTPKNGPVPRATLEEAGANTYTGRAIGESTAFRLVDADGNRIADAGVTGRIETRGEYCFTEYFNQPEQTAIAFTEDGWFKTGDLGFSTADGALVLIGRESGMIRRSGENIAPREIELALEDHPAIKEALVVGVPDEARGQEILARIVLADGASLTAHDVFAYLDDQLSAFKVPRFLEFRDEFERTPTFKIKLKPDTSASGRAAWHDRLNP